MTSETKAYEVTGTTRDGKRFKRTFAKEDFRGAWGVNLWRGSVWRIPVHGKRELLKRVWN